NLREAVKDPSLAPFVWTSSNDITTFNGFDRPSGNGGHTLTILTAPPNISLLQADPNLFNNKPVGRNFENNFKMTSVATNVPPHDIQDVVFEARSGDIKTLVLNLQSVPFRKRVTIDAANNIEAFTAKIGVPDGVVATVHAGNSLNMRTAGTLGK